MNKLLSSWLSRLVVDRRAGYRREVLKRFDELKRFDKLSRDEIDAYVLSRLAETLNYVRDNSLFYRERIPDGIAADNALSGIPVLTKQDIQLRGQDMLVPGSTFFKDATGGSSGEPTVFYTDLKRKQAGEAATYWSNSLAGFEYGERVAMLWGSHRDCRPETIADRPEGGERDCSSSQRGCEPLGDARSGVPRVQFVQLKALARNVLENVRWYNAFDMGEDRMHEFHSQMTRFAPHLIVAYAGSLYEYAQFLGENGLRPTYPLTGIVSSAEVLTSVMRKSVERVFERLIFDRYGNRGIWADCSGMRSA